MRIWKHVCLLAVAFSTLALSMTTYAQNAKAGAKLRSEPSASGNIVRVLSQETPVDLIGRKGFWINVKVAESKGWLSIKELSASKKGSTRALNTGRQTKGNIVATSAARGLTAEDLVSARPDFDAFGQLTGLGVSVGDAEKFSRDGQLATRELAMLSGPTGSKAPMKASKGVSGTEKKVKKAKNADGDDDDDEDEDEEDGDD